MRAVVRERLLAGESDSEILAYMRERYGDYVLMRPPLQANTIALWFGPFIALLIGGVLIAVFIRRQSSVEESWTEEDEAELARLRDEEGQA